VMSVVCVFSESGSEAGSQDDDDDEDRRLASEPVKSTHRTTPTVVLVSKSLGFCF